MTPPQDDSALARRFGVVLHDKGDHSEDAMADAVTALQADGLRVGGLYQRTTAYPSGRSRMDLIDIANHTAHEISQDLGAGSSACCLNPGALLDASAVLRRDITAGVDLLVVNKFAGMEVDGEGLAPDAFEALAMGIPVLTCLSTRYRAQFDALTGGLATMLPPDAAALRVWALGVLRGGAP